MDLNSILLSLGDPGRYQALAYLMLWLCNSLVAMNSLIMGIYDSVPNHHCSLPTGKALNTSIPMLYENNKKVLSSCSVYSQYNASLGKTVPCPHGWDYAFKSGDGRTIVTEWNLVCDEKFLSKLATTIYFAGVMFGSLLFGILSDMYGRRPVLLGTLYGHIILGTAIAIMPNFIGFVILRFCLGMLIQGLQTSAYILMIEMTPIKNRTTVGGLFEVFWAIGTMWMATIAWALKNWRSIQLAMCLPSVVTILYWWVITESIRWLLIKERKKEALEVVLKIAAHNRVKVPEDIEVQISTVISVKPAEGLTVLGIVKEKMLRKRALHLFYIWMATSIGYYGLSLNAASLAGNRYLNFFISGVLELPAFLMCMWILKSTKADFCSLVHEKGPEGLSVSLTWICFMGHSTLSSGVYLLSIPPEEFGRPKPLLCFLVIGGMTCIISGTVPKRTDSGKDISILSTSFALIGKFFTAAAFAAIFLFTSELFPTSVRNAGMGGCTFWARAGGMVSPQLLLMGDYTFKELPILIFGGLLLLGAASASVLPETKGKKLPDTLEELRESIRKNDDDMDEMESTIA